MSNAAPSPDASPEVAFLFSLPRSGSTLLQRMLGSHSAIATCPEPWLLLPLLGATNPDVGVTAYSQWIAAAAIRDMWSRLPNGRADYDAVLRRAVTDLYGRMSTPDTRYFLDKTPRYGLIIDDIVDLFPDSPAIVLWRHPLAVVASIVETWARGHWGPFGMKVDLYESLANIIDAVQRRPDRFITVRYEDLVAHPVTQSSRLLDALGLEWEDAVVEDFADTRLDGAMGDKQGKRAYQTVSKAPLDKWKRSVSSPVRKAWCRRYVQWIGPERHAVMGYDMDEILRELDEIPTSMRPVPDDLVSVARGTLWSASEPRLFRHKLALWPDWARIYSHS